MKKTSKKLLSFFLAVVMVITSCSVGLVAWAADVNPTDNNNDYWSDTATASEALSSLTDLADTYIPLLLNIDSIKSALESIGVTVTEDMTLSDLLTALSPLLIDLFGYLGKSRANAIDSYSTFALTSNSFYGNTSGSVSSSFETFRIDKYYSYLETNYADGDTYSIYSLLAFCAKYMNNGNSDLAKYCSETYAELSTLFNAYQDLYISEDIGTALNSVAQYFDFEDIGSEDLLTIRCLSLDELKEYKVNGKALGNVTDISDYSSAYSLYLAIADYIGYDGITISDMADVVYYTCGYGYYEFYNAYLLYLINLGGGIPTAEDLATWLTAFWSSYGYDGSISDDIKDTVLTYSNMTSLATEILSETVENIVADGYNDILTSDSAISFYVVESIYAAFEDYELTGTNGWVMGAGTGYYDALCTGVIALSGETDDAQSLVSDLYITHDQIVALFEWMKAEDEAGTWNDTLNTYYNVAEQDILDGNTKAYLASHGGQREYGSIKASGVFSDEVANYLYSIMNTTLAQTYLKYDNYSSCEEAAYALEAYVKDDYSVFSNMSLIDRVNYMVASEHIMTIYGDDTFDGRVIRPASSFAIYYLQFDLILADMLSEYSYDYSDYVIPEELAVYVVNMTIDGALESYWPTVEEVLAGGNDTIDMVFGILDSILENFGFNLNLSGGFLDGILEKFDINIWKADGSGVLNDLWLSLCEAPIDTIIEMIPTLVIIINELIVPLFLNEGGNAWNTLVTSLLDGSLWGELKDDLSGLDLSSLLGDTSLDDIFDIISLYEYSQDFANETTSADDESDVMIGIGQFYVDLNTALPSILAWLIGDSQTAYDLVGCYDYDSGDYNDWYNDAVPRFLNIYVVDKALYGAHLNGGLAKTLKNSGTAESTANLLDEILTEIATFALEAINQYLDTNGDDERYSIASGTYLQKGLNNIFVALPEVIDYMGKLFVEKYEIDSDWTYIFSGKITEVTYKNADGVTVVNQVLRDFEDLALYNNVNDIFDSLVNILIGNWINALLDLVNDLIQDDDNLITSEIPIITGVLEALGGFGETSVITDLLDGLFQMKRSDDQAFTLVERETGFVGFSNASGFFLLGNLEYTDTDGTNKGIIPLILNIINHDSTSTYKTTNAFSVITSLAPTLMSSSKVSSTSSSELLTTENEKAAQKLIDVVDKLLASLLENTSLNDYDWDSTDSVLSSIISFFSNYLGAQNTNDIVKLINNYLEYIIGDDEITTATSSGDVNAKKVYTSANLSVLVIQTYSLVENIIDYLFYNTSSGLLASYDPDQLLADAIYGIISPDAVAVRMDDSYSKTIKVLSSENYLNWNSFKVQITAEKAVNGTWTVDYLKYGFKAGDKDAFYDALGESLSGVAAILGVLLADTGYYESIVYPILDSIGDATGTSSYVMSVKAFNKATDSQKLINGIIYPLGAVLETLFDGTPFTSLINILQGVAGVLTDKQIKKIINGAIDPLNDELDGICNLLNYLSPTLYELVYESIGGGAINVSLTGSNYIVTLLNKLLSSTGITLSNINWSKFNKATDAQAFLMIYGYIVDLVLSIPAVVTLLDKYLSGFGDLVNNLSASEILTLVTDVLSVVKSPTEIYWTFAQYASSLSNSFTYPTSITADEADEAVTQLDDLITNLFSLLSAFGVDIDGLYSLVSDNLYTNSILTTIAKALYGALDSDAVTPYLELFGLDVSPSGIATYLTDSSYGKTYSKAAKTLKSVSSWSDVTSLNWGFTDGSSKAETGFINGLAAIFRPFNNILSMFLVEGSVDFSKIDYDAILALLNTSGSTTLGSGEYGCTLKYSISDGVLTLKFQSNVLTHKGNNTEWSTLKIDLSAIIEDLKSLNISDSINLGTNGYESAIIPILEAFMCDGVKTYSQYQSDYNKAKDNLLVDVLTPILDFVHDVCDAPFDTVTAVLPNVAYFLDSNGLMQAVGNLLSPVTSTDGLLGILANHGLDINDILTSLLGADLGSLLTNLIGIDVDLTIDLMDLSTCNIQDILVPLLQSLLSNYGLTLPTFTFAQIASHGDLQTVKSAAKNSNGKYTTKQIDADQGEVLIAVLRYVAQTLIVNATAIQNLLLSIDSIGSNDTISGILKSVFGQLKTAGKDDIVRAVFYFLTEDQTNAFFDYTDFTIGSKTYSFTYGNMDEDFCESLAPMLDGLINGLLEGGLNGLLGGYIYTDSVISSLAVGLYSAIESVSITDDMSLTSLLAMTDIDFSSSNVASLLTNSAYGETYPSAASTIRSAGSWANVDKDSLVWGVTDRDSFMNALCAVLRPIYGVLDVILNDASLNLFNLVSIPGSDGYTSTIVPLLEAFGCYNIKTQYQYREDIYSAYDNILLDIINPLWDKVEDILNAPIEMIADILPNLSLFFANDGLLQIIDNLLTPISALLEAIRPIVDLNDLLDVLGLDVPALLASIGLDVDMTLDLYDLPSTLEPLIGAENVVNLLNQILGLISISGTPLGLVLPEIDWYQLASHGNYIFDGTSQAATYGSRISVESDQAETLIAVLRYLINTINYEDNYQSIVDLIGGLLGDSVSDSISDVISQVLGMLQGDADDVIEDLVDLLQTLAG